VSKLRLSLGCWNYDRTRALQDGRVKADGIDLVYLEMPVEETFFRMLRHQEFDVAEMSLSSYTVSLFKEKKNFIAIPVFPSRFFRHSCIYVNANAGIREPKDLIGRKVGNPEYQMTAPVWIRGILQDEYGVDLDKVTWVLSGDEHVAEYRPPSNVVPMPEGGDLLELLAAGDLAAVVGVEAEQPGVVPLVPRAEEAAYDALQSRGLYPINHLVVVKDELLDAHPDLATDLFDAFAAAKNLYVERLRKEPIDDPTPTDVMYKRVLDIRGDDPLPYGIAPNRENIELLIRHAVSQRVLDQPVDAESLFHPSTRDLIA
jgi:4,5-dihydroxyphthalate decarboxylase